MYKIIKKKGESLFLKINKAFFFSVFFFILMIFYSCEREYNYLSINPKLDAIYTSKNPYKSDIKTMSSESVGKKYYLCKVFGVLLFHTSKENNTLNNSIDSLLQEIDTISLEQYKNKIQTLVNSYYYNIDNAEIVHNKINLEENTNLSLNWLKDSVYINKETGNMLNRIIYTYNESQSVDSMLKQSNIGIVGYKTTPYSISSSKLPDKRDRLIGLFYYWNFVEYFYPYKTLLDNNWDDVLLESILDFESANSIVDYKKSIIKLISFLDDNHSIIHPQNLTSVFGEYVPNFRMVKIDSGFVVNKIRSKSLDNELIKVGDIILEIDSVDINKLATDLAPYATGANEYSKSRELNKLLVCKKNKTHIIKIKRDDSIFNQNIQFYNFQSLNKSERKEERFWENKNIAKKVSEGIGYVNINHLFEDNIESSLEKLHKFNKGVIIDMRGYPNGYTSSKLVNFVISRDTLIYCSYYPDINRPGLFRCQMGSSVLKIKGNKSYKRKIVLLVDETTQSHAEFLVMTMQTNPNVLVVGNTSSGTDGNVTGFTFPGNIEVKMTGLGILYPDFSQTQRKGVKIDSRITYSFSDISSGIDSWITKGIDVILEEYN